MTAATAVGLGLAVASTTLTNLAYVREHDAAAHLPALALRRPLHSAQLLLRDHSWMLGFALESSGFLLYAAALGLLSLALVQSIAAGGIGVLAFVSARIARRRLSRVELAGVLVSFLGLVLLAVSLVGGSAKGSSGATERILVWLGITAAVALVLLGTARRGVAAANGAAGGLFFSIGDISTKLVTQGGARIAFVLPLIVGYTLGTALLQIGYQAGGALAVAGIATLLTNALPIAAGAFLFHEPLPGGALGVIRVVAFGAVVIGAVLLSRPPATQRRDVSGDRVCSRT